MERAEATMRVLGQKHHEQALFFLGAEENISRVNKHSQACSDFLWSGKVILRMPALTGEYCDKSRHHRR